MTKLIALAIIATLAACGGKKTESTTPANKTGTTTGSGAMGGTTYGGAGSAAPAPTSGGDPCAM